MTTLHTNSAAGAVARLQDMGVEPYLLASVLRGVVGQRLVGVLCHQCKRPREATPAEREIFAAAGVASAGEMILHDAVGCRACDEIGFVGRRGIFELMDTSDQMRELIRSRAPTQALVSEAIGRGMRTMATDGLHKALAGLTTIEEVTRVTQDW